MFKPDDQAAKRDGNTVSHDCHGPTPWVAAEEMQPKQRANCSTPLDDVDEALMESFPCSDPPCYSHAHA